MEARGDSQRPPRPPLRPRGGAGRPRALAPDLVCTLSDALWGGADPAGAWALQRRDAPPTVRGDTDEFLLADPTDFPTELRADRAFLERELGGILPEPASLPVTATVAGGEVLLAHGCPASPWNALFRTGRGEAARPARPDELSERVALWPGARVVVGHTHQEQIVSRGG